MDLGVTKKVRPLIEAVREIVNDEIVPLEVEFFQEVENAENRFSFTPRMTEILEGLKEKARDRGLDGNASNPEWGIKGMNFIPLFVRKALEYINSKD